MRRGDVYRLPLPPQLKGTLQSAPEDLKTMQEHLNLMTKILNQGLLTTHNRLNTIQQTGAKAPPSITGFTVTGKQGLFYLTWNRIVNTDGYVIVQASDAGMVNLIGRYNVVDGDTCTFSIPVGNVAVTNTFQIYAYQGPRLGPPSSAVTATTLTFTTPEAAPPTPPISPRQPKRAFPRSGPNLP
jgi:hypothetical protein